MNNSLKILLIIALWSLSAVIKAQDSFIVHILADDDYPPYSFVEHGQLKGVYVELVKRAAKQLKPTYHIKLIPMPWKRALSMVENGEAFAILPPYKHLDSRPYIFPYSVPLYEEHVVVYCHRRFNLSAFFESKSKKRPINLGINSGYLILNEEYLNAVKNNRINLRANKSTEANIKKLLKGRIDCYVNDELTIAQGLKAESGNTSIHKLFEKKDALSAQTAHIGYSLVNPTKFPFKKDFIEKMDSAILKVKEQYPIEHLMELNLNQHPSSHGN